MMALETMLKFVRSHGFLCYEDNDSRGIVIEIGWVNSRLKTSGITKFVAMSIYDCRQILGY